MVAPTASVRGDVYGLPLAQGGGTHGYLRVLGGSHTERHPPKLPIPVIAILEDPDARTRQPRRLDDAPFQWLKKKGTKSNRAARARPPLPAAAAGAELRHSDPWSAQPDVTSLSLWTYLLVPSCFPVWSSSSLEKGKTWDGIERLESWGPATLASPVVHGLLMDRVGHVSRPYHLSFYPDRWCHDPRGTGPRPFAMTLGDSTALDLLAVSM
jgi:hypothetical protein